MIKMKCHTARGKLEEAQFFLKKIQEVYKIDSNDIEYYLNAFVVSCRSVLDYVIQDFLISKKIDMETRDFKNKKTREMQLSGSEDFQEIEDFVQKFEKEFQDLHNNRLTHYFLEKRKTVHNGFAGTKAGNFTEENGSHIVTERFLEPSIDDSLYPETVPQSNNPFYDDALEYKDHYSDDNELLHCLRHLEIHM